MSFSETDLRIEALHCATRLIGVSEEADVEKRAGQAIYVAEMLLDWLRTGVAPQVEGNLRKLYFINHPFSNGQSGYLRQGKKQARNEYGHVNGNI